MTKYSVVIQSKSEEVVSSKKFNTYKESLECFNKQKHIASFGFDIFLNGKKADEYGRI